MYCLYPYIAHNETTMNVIAYGMGMLCSRGMGLRCKYILDRNS